MHAHLLADAAEIAELAKRMPLATDYQQSAGRVRWLVGTGRDVRVACVEGKGEIRAWAVLERSSDDWAMWKGPGGSRAERDVLSLLLAKMRCVQPCMLVLDPHWHFADAIVRAGWHPSGVYRTSLVDVRLEAEMLAGMNDATRRRIRHAEREGVEVISDDPALLDAFYATYSECMLHSGSPDFISRDELHSVLAGSDMHLFTALHKGQVIAGSVCSRNANSLEARYVATSTAHRALGGLNLVHYASMRWARNQGLTYLDLSGIAVDSASEKLANINRFKLGFGGTTLDYPVYR